MTTQTLTVEVPGAVTSGAVAETIEVPQNGSLDRLVLTAGTAGSAPTVVDVLVNGVDVFAAPVGTLAGVDSTGQNTATSGIAATDMRIGVSVDGLSDQPGIDQNPLILIDSEQISVNKVQGSNSQQGAGTTIQGGPITNTSSGFTLDLFVTARGANGTTAAAHTHGTPVFAVKPTLASGTKSSSLTGFVAPVKLNAGDVLSFSVAPGSGVADLTIEAELTVN